jgi:hypothetical protein
VAAPEDMIWEVDEDGDGCVSWDEYMSCYERAVADKAGLEPRKLSTLVEFLMLDEEENNWVRRRRWHCFAAALAGRVGWRRFACAHLAFIWLVCWHQITVDAIVNLMVMRLGPECPDAAIRAMFGDDGSETMGVRKITYQEFVEAGSLTGSGAQTRGRRRGGAQKLLTR